MCESPLYALMALRGDTGLTGNVVIGGAFSFQQLSGESAAIPGSRMRVWALVH
jgi:hypothetical protein